MTDQEKACWQEFRAELPWLNGSHRVLLRLACLLSARMDGPDLGVNASAALSAILSKLGATPIDESKVAHRPDDRPDPDARFFTPPR